MHNTEAFNVV